MIESSFGKVKAALFGCVIIIAALVAGIFWLQTNYQEYMRSHSYTDFQYNSLESLHQSYVNTHQHSDSEYENLVNQIESLTAPRLFGPGGLQTYDAQSGMLQFAGCVFNVGERTAYNCQLEITGYDEDWEIVFESTIYLGTIDGHLYRYVEEEIYIGSISTWTVTPKWTD